VVVAVLRPPLTLMFALAPVEPPSVSGDTLVQNRPSVMVGVVMLTELVLVAVVVPLVVWFTITGKDVVAVLPALSVPVQSRLSSRD